MGNEYYFAWKAFEWTKAVIFQGERTIETANHTMKLYQSMFTDISSPNSFLQIDKAKEDFENYRFRQFMEEHFFLITLGKSIDFLKKFNEFENIVNNIYDKFGKTTIDDLRNMREHDDEFIVGNGKTRPQNFIYHDLQRSSISDATSTGIDFAKKEYLLGGRLNIYEVIDFYNERLELIKTISDKLIKEMADNEISQ